MVLFKTIRKYIKQNKTNFEKSDTKAVTREEPFQSVLIYTIGNNLHPLDVNKVRKYTFWKGTAKRVRPIFNIE